MPLLGLFTHFGSLSVNQGQYAKGRVEMNICDRSDGRQAAVMVHCSLFMTLCLNLYYFVYLDVCARVVCARVLK